MLAVVEGECRRSRRARRAGRRTASGARRSRRRRARSGRPPPGRAAGRRPCCTRFPRSGMSRACGWISDARSSGSPWKPPVASTVAAARTLRISPDGRSELGAADLAVLDEQPPRLCRRGRSRSRDRRGRSAHTRAGSWGSRSGGRARSAAPRPRAGTRRPASAPTRSPARSPRSAARRAAGPLPGPHARSASSEGAVQTKPACKRAAAELAFLDEDDRAPLARPTRRRRRGRPCPPPRTRRSTSFAIMGSFESTSN